MTEDDVNRAELEDFLARYEDGAPSAGVSDEEVLRHHARLASDLSPDDHRDAATRALERMERSERADLGRRLRMQAESEGFDVRDATSDDSLEDSSLLGSLAGRLHERRPGAVSELLASETGSGVDGILNSPAARGALAGIAAVAARKILR